MKIAQVDFNTLQPIASPKFNVGTTLGDIVNKVVEYVFPIAGFVLLIYLVYGGYQYLMSMGDPQKIAKARDHITWAIVGFIIVFSAYWIVRFAGVVLDLDKITDIF